MTTPILLILWIVSVVVSYFLMRFSWRRMDTVTRQSCPIPLWLFVWIPVLNIILALAILLMTTDDFESRIHDKFFGLK